MEYERIHKVQTGIISPSKLRMKLTGNHHQKKKDGSNCNSSRTSPSRLEDSEFVNNSLLATQTSDFQEQYSRLDAAESMTNAKQGADGSNSDQPKEKRGAAYAKKQQVPKTDVGNSSSVHPVKGYEDENLDYDSTSSFEFHKGERSTHHYSMSARPSSRPMSSKWNDAEKWIMNRQNVQVNSSKKVQMQNQANRVSMLRVASECSGYESRTAVKRVDFCQPAMAERFGFAHPCPQSQSNGANAALLDLCNESKDLTEVDNGDSCTQTCVDDQTGVPAIRSVCMRDMGTEMTPIPSQEPSRTATPVGATTPLRTPTSSIPSTPRRGDPAPTPAAHNFNSNPSPERHNKTKLSEQEVKMKARRDIAALGVQLGKMNIAAWASKDESNTAEVRQSEYAKSAAAWEEAEKSKHVARFKREEIKIQEWESEQKSKLEAEMRKIEVQVEQIRADAQAKIVKKIRATLEKSEEKRASAEARRNRQSEKAAEQAEYIRQTGRLPSSSFMCCGWSS